MFQSAVITLETHFLSNVIIIWMKYTLYRYIPVVFVFRIQRLRFGQTSPNQNSVNTRYSSTAKALSMDTSQVNKKLQVYTNPPSFPHPSIHFLHALFRKIDFKALL